MYGWVSTFKPYATSFPVLLILCSKFAIPLPKRFYRYIYFYSQDKANQASTTRLKCTSNYVLYRPPFIRAGKIAGNFSNFAIRG